METVCKNHTASSDSHYFLQPGHADDQRPAGLYTVLYHYPGKTPEFHTVLHGGYVQRNLCVLQSRIWFRNGMGDDPYRCDLYIGIVCNEEEMGI